MPGISASTRGGGNPNNSISSSSGYDKLFGVDRLSDLTVQISGGPESCHLEDTLPALTLPAHKIVLYVHSPCFQAKIEDWCDEPFKNSSSSSSSSIKKDGKPVLSLEVPYGGLDIGRKLVQVMYSGSPDLSDMMPKQLLQLAAMADKYMVDKALSAAGEALQQVDWAALSCEEAAAVFEVPDSGNTLAAHQEVVKTARAAAAKRLGALLGDLEEVWGEGIASSSGSSSRSQQLLQLPAEALLYLLSGHRFKAASEDTVFHTVTQWLAAHPGTPADMQRSLAGELQLANCTPTYFIEVVCPLQLADAAEVPAAKEGRSHQCPVQHASTAAQFVDQQARGGGTYTVVPPAVLPGCMPGTRVGCPGSCAAACRHAKRDPIPGAPAPVFWQGREWGLSMVVNTVSKSFTVSLTSSGAAAVCDVTCRLFALPESYPGERTALTMAPITGLLGTPQVLGLQEGQPAPIMSCHIHPDYEHYADSQWWCPLHGEVVDENDKYTHFKLCVEVAGIQ